MFRRRALSSKNGGEDENPFLLSFSDLMASLLAIFIFVLVVTLVELEKRKEELRFSKQELIENLEGIQQAQNGIVSELSDVVQREHSLSLMLTQIQNDLQKSSIEVIIAESGTVLRIPDQQLHFALGRYDIPSAYIAPANAIGQALLKSLMRPENRSMLDTVFVEGHTDSVVNNREMGNWGLSTYRAISLWNFWTESPGHLTEFKTLQTIPLDPTQHPKPLISVSGYADTRSTHGPLDGKGLKDDRPEDRRIDIRFTLVSSEKKNLENLHENLKEMQEKMSVLINKLRATNHDH
ncbi:MAG: OmpA family protein [Deltaproteobacteria bacterium]|nr:OmpA family protein [Deltaproteobacteria bacterium]